MDRGPQKGFSTYNTQKREIFLAYLMYRGAPRIGGRPPTRRGWRWFRAWFTTVRRRSLDRGAEAVGDWADWGIGGAKAVGIARVSSSDSERPIPAFFLGRPDH